MIDFAIPLSQSFSPCVPMDRTLLLPGKRKYSEQVQTRPLKRKAGALWARDRNPNGNKIFAKLPGDRIDEVTIRFQAPSFSIECSLPFPRSPFPPSLHFPRSLSLRHQYHRIGRQYNGYTTQYPQNLDRFDILCRGPSPVTARDAPSAAIAAQNGRYSLLLHI